MRLASSAPGVRPGDEAELASFISRYLERAEVIESSDIEFGDLGLVFALRRHRPEAMRFLQTVLLPRVAAAASRGGARPEATEDAAQAAVTLLLQRGPEDPGAYRGRGSLLGWLCVVAMRDAKRDHPPLDHEDDAHFALSAFTAQHELDYMRRLYGPQVEQCLTVAFGELDARERNLLRFQIVEGLNVRQIGTFYGVHHATAARWLEAVRKRLFSRTRDLMKSSFALDSSEFTSVIRLLRSDLEARIAPVFASMDVAEDR